MEIQHSNILGMFFDAAEKHPERQAVYLHDGPSCRTYSFAEVRAAVWRATAVLKGDAFCSEELIASQFVNPFWDLVYFLAAGAVGLGVYVPSKGIEVEKRILDVLNINRLISGNPIDSHGRTSLVGSVRISVCKAIEY